MTASSHHWRFFRAGGFDQVRIDTPADLAALHSLDQKLWAALACPVQGLEFDARTLAYIDADKDGRIRAPELLNAVDWALSVLKDPGVLFTGQALALSVLNDTEAGVHLAASARRLLVNIGLPDAAEISVVDTDDLARIFPPEKPNGDGLVPAAMTDDEALKAAIADIIVCLGAETDRSREAAVSEAKINDFFTQADSFVAWYQRAAKEASLQPFGEATNEAMASLSELRAKVDDYFNRVRMAAFDPRAGGLMNGEEAELIRLAALDLASAAETAQLPLANIANGCDLPLTKGINPAWIDAVARFREKVVLPLLGEKSFLSEADWKVITAKCAPHFSWLDEKPALGLDALEPARIVWLVEHDVREKLLALVAQDKAVAAEAEGLLDVDKLVRFQKNLVTLLNNFISFREFYTRRDKAVFQAGTLYIDGKSAELVVRVNDLARHSAMAGASGSYLVYCECTCQGSAEKMTVVAAITAGDAGNLMAGRNGIFYDRKGVDWDAHVIKLIEHSISVREAFWTPYRRIGKMISDQAQRMAASRDKASEEKSAASVTASATHVENAPAAAMTAAAAAVPATPAVPPFDIARFAGIFAAIGLAIGAIGTTLAAIAAGFLSLLWWQMPLALLGVVLLISGPSMVLAWFKLRKRNLAPILDANGWAVNTRAGITISFGTELTQLARLPKGSERALADPYAGKRNAWLWWLLAILLALAAYYGWQHGWFGGK